MLYRFFYKSLDSWYAHRDRRPLIVRGARQVGKSHTVREWVKGSFGEDALLEINLEESSRYRELFKREVSADSLIDQLNLLTGFNLRLPNKILFIDEIQAAPEALNSLRFFYEQKPEVPVIAAGSLLEFAIEKLGTPVGRVEYLHLLPMSFREFLLAQGKEQLSDFIHNLSIEEPIPEVVHKQLLDFLLVYMRIGGMPKAVSAYCATRDIREVSREHELLLETYREDFPKYARRSQIEILNSTFLQIPHHIALQKVKYAKIEPESRVEKTKRAVELLSSAHLITKVTCSIAEKLPLIAAEKSNFFRLLFLDIGLLQHALGFDWQQLDLSCDISTICNGRFAEQFVGQELIAERSSVKLYKPHYWERPKIGSDAEVDYLIEHKGEVVPLEVKSGKKGSLKSLHLYMQEQNPSIALIASQRNLERMDRLQWIPLYLVGQLLR